MNSKRAKVLRKVAKSLIALGIYPENTQERTVYKRVKKADKSLTTPQKEVFSANKIEATLS